MSWGATPSIDADTIREHQVDIMQLLNLSTLVPLLKKHQLLPKKDLDRIGDTKHHGTIERTGFLLHSLYSKDQAAIDTFVQCLREDTEHPGHQEIVSLLERGLPDQPERSPIFDVLDARMRDVVKLVNITAFLNTLANKGAIRVTAFLDLANPDRTVEENLQRLLHVLEEKGIQGFIDFLACLRTEYAENHEELFKLLFGEVQRFFKEHPRRGEIALSDKIEILQLESRGKDLEQKVLKRFNDNFKHLIDKIDVKELLPYLDKHHVLSEEEAAMVSDDSLTKAERNQKFLELLQSRPPFWIVKFTDCMKEAGKKYKDLLDLLLPASDIPSAEKDTRVLHKKDKILVVVPLEKYVTVDRGYQLEEYLPGGGTTGKHNDASRNLAEQRKEMCDFFSGRLDFEVVELELSIEARVEKKDKEEEEKDSHEHWLVSTFYDNVTKRCTEEAVVFIYISGIQFPFRPNQDKKEQGEKDAGEKASSEKYGGAVLLTKASTVSRKETDYLKCRDILAWLKQLPHAHITLLFDCEQNFVSRFGKQREPEMVEILDDPWSELTGLSTSTVVYYLRPDIRAMAQLKNKDVRQATGTLTEGFNFALRHCCSRRVPGGAQQQQQQQQHRRLSHRGLYEAMSLYWHKRGRQHRAFIPAVRGDVDREFLGKRAFPYQQVFRVELVKSEISGELFDFKKLYVQTGTMAGIIYGDVLEVFHVLCPEFKVRATVSQSQPLNAVIEIKDQETLTKFRNIVEELYQSGLQTKDGSTEFLLAYKMFPVHERVQISTDGLTDGENATVKSYAEFSTMLVFTPKPATARVLVKRSGGFYVVEDKDRDITADLKVKRLPITATFLAKIAWYKYVKKLKSGHRAGRNFECHMTAEKRLLHVAVPLCEDFNIKWSSFDKAPHNSKGHEVILQAADTQDFWTPSPPSADANPCLEVEFRDNHVITAIEIKGDYREDVFVREADIYHQRDVWSEEVEGPSRTNPSKSVQFHHEEAVQFVTITPRTDLKENFTIAIKMTCRMMASSGKPIYKLVGNATIINWSYYQSRTGWKISPSPDQSGRVNLLQPSSPTAATTQDWITWTGRSPHPLTFDLGMPGLRLDKIEFETVGKANCLSKFLMRLQTSWKKEQLPPIKSVWPFKHEFPLPLLLSNIQLWPKEPPDPGPSHLQPRPDQSRIKLQLQLYGNKRGIPVEVEEGDILTFHFSNSLPTTHFVYILCLEETGDIKLVMMDVAEPAKQSKDEATKFMCMKKLIQTYIPDDHSDLNQIKDTYKVFVCQRKMYLEPFIQENLLHYNKPCSYSICALGHKDMRKEVWYDYMSEAFLSSSLNKGGGRPGDEAT